MSHALARFHAGTPRNSAVKLRYFGGYYYIQGIDNLRIIFRPAQMGAAENAGNSIHARIRWGKK